MTSEFTQLSTLLILQNRPLTKIALDNKIRAMISQFHPRERYFTYVIHENTLGRISSDINPINPIRKEYLKSKLSFPIIKSSIMMKEQIKIDDFSLMNKRTDEYIYTYKKVTRWLEHANQ
jgi:uncharacterized membrane protein